MLWINENLDDLLLCYYGLSRRALSLRCSMQTVFPLRFVTKQVTNHNTWLAWPSVVQQNLEKYKLHKLTMKGGAFQTTLQYSPTPTQSFQD